MDDTLRGGYDIFGDPRTRGLRSSGGASRVDAEVPLDRAFQRWLDPGNFDSDGRQRTPLSALTGPILVARV